MNNNQLIEKLQSYKFKLLKNINYFDRLYIEYRIVEKYIFKNGLKNGLYKSY